MSARGIVWLASYPKSGNTWVRVFLTNLRRGGPDPAHINDLDRDGMFASRELVENVLPHPMTDLRPDELLARRREAFEWLGSREGPPLFVKVHDSLTAGDGRDLVVPVAVTRGAIYVVRNPLDIVSSLADHLGIGIDRAVRTMAQPSFTMADPRGGLAHQIPQRLGTWSGHVTDWLDGAPFPVHVVRYDDLKARPFETFRELARFGGLPTDERAVEQAIRHSDFSELRRQEETHGFLERSPASGCFFRKGETGGWRSGLDAAQARGIVNAHAAVMQRLGYGAEVDEVRGSPGLGRAS